ncbi:chromate transporter [Caulobacter sp. S45]|uniref:chromate transporter n=1 Tax=Caulobacter sp. S45 TaxID=1641861 RepID=UPI00131ABE91|nr:chromate transporter [Caulobacter sp. S45]
MKPGVLLALAKTFGGLSLVAVGGANAAVPEIQRQVVGRLHWMDDGAFAHLFAISQAAPGPNVLLVSLIGWRVAGLAGLLVATVAMNLPSSLLAFAAGRAWRRWSASPWIGRLQRVLGPIAVGLIVASGVVMARTSDHGLIAAGLTAAVAAFVVFSRRSPMWALGAAAVAGVALNRLGVGL